jgi:ATP-dependent DNA helicase RecG
VLLFGQAKYLRKLIARPVVDYQRCDIDENEWSPEMRWHDRLLVEENLIQAWRLLLERFHTLSEHKFAVDADTMRRKEDPPDYISFREALINLLIHQDFGDSSRTARFKIFSDRSIFWNPGDAFDSTSELLDPSEKQLRNPCIVSVFRRVGLSDQAGTGIRTICKNWHSLGHQPPILKNEKANKAFELILTKLPLITEKQKLFQAQIGVKLNALEADVFAHICEHGQISIVELKSIVCRTETDCIELIQRLVNQVIVVQMVTGKQWGLVEHFREILGHQASSDSPKKSMVTHATDQAEEKLPSLVTFNTDQAHAGAGSLVTPTLTKLTDKQRSILQFCDVPQPQDAIMRKLNVTHRSHFKKQHLGPLITANLVRLAFPETPTHPDQTYCITEQGLGLISD